MNQHLATGLENSRHEGSHVTCAVGHASPVPTSAQLASKPVERESCLKPRHRNFIQPAHPGRSGSKPTSAVWLHRGPGLSLAALLSLQQQVPGSRSQVPVLPLIKSPLRQAGSQGSITSPSPSM